MTNPGRLTATGFLENLMHIRLDEIRYGPGIFQNKGDVIDLPDGEAQELVDRGRATAIAKPQPVIETAMANQSGRIETATAPRQSRPNGSGKKSTKRGNHAT